MSDNYLIYDPAAFGALEIKEDTRDAEILRLRAENEKLRAECDEQARLNGMGGEREAKLASDNARLRATLKPFAEMNVTIIDDTRMFYSFTCDHIRAAAAALKETGDD